MSDTYEVISAFLDDEPFDSRSLADALGDPAGRDLLIDLMALRHLTQTEVKEAPTLTHQKPRAALRALAAVAAVLVALVGGYLFGERRSEVAMSAAPAATRVVQAAAPWRDAPVGRMR
jgi:hypothetical protein